MFSLNAVAGKWIDPIEYSEYNPVLLSKSNWLRVEEPLPENLKKLTEKPEGMQIISAVYGTGDNRRFKDVTEIVRDKVRNNNGILKLTVSNSLFTDPAYGDGKRLKVVYKLGDKELVEEVRENGFIQLPKFKTDFLKINRPEFAGKPRLLHRDFELSNKPVKSYIYAAALGIYEMRINGRRVGGINSSEEILSYSNSVAVQCFDVAPLLVKGVNTIGVVLANGQYCGPLKSDPARICVFGYEPHFRAEIEMIFADGSSAVVSTDNRWQGTYQFAADYATVIDNKSTETPKEILGWDSPGFKCSDKWDKALIDRTVECNLHMFR